MFLNKLSHSDNLSISQRISRIVYLSIGLIIFGFLCTSCQDTNADKSQRVQQVSEMNGLIAFWDFSQKNNDLWTSYFDENTVDTAFEIVLRRIGDEQSYSPENWPHNDADSELIFDSSGPFGNAVRFNQGYIFGAVPRSEFENTPLNIHGNKPFTLVAWTKFNGERHFVTGIWDEGGWNKYGGRRQYALFGGLFNSKGAIAHVSATGASSYPQSTIEGSQYARKRAIDGQDFENDQWVAMAMTFDPETKMVTAFLDGDSTKTNVTDPVADDVFQYDQEVSSNPFYFPWPIFSPKSFVLKFNGYDFQSSGVYEHWLEIDVDSFSITYGQNSAESFNEDQEYKVQFDVQRDGESILSSPLEQTVTESNELFGPDNKSIKVGDTILASLYHKMENQWQKIGSTVNYQVREGAPFTFGRALGLGDEPIDDGSQLFIDGVAVFDRILSKEELENLSFKSAN